MDKIAAYEMILEDHPLWAEKLAADAFTKRLYDGETFKRVSDYTQDKALRRYIRGKKKAKRIARSKTSGK